MVKDKSGYQNQILTTWGREVDEAGIIYGSDHPITFTHTCLGTNTKGEICNKVRSGIGFPSLTKLRALGLIETGRKNTYGQKENDWACYPFCFVK